MMSILNDRSKLNFDESNFSDDDPNEIQVIREETCQSQKALPTHENLAEEYEEDSDSIRLEIEESKTDLTSISHMKSTPVSPGCLSRRTFVSRNSKLPSINEDLRDFTSISQTSKTQS